MLHVRTGQGGRSDAIRNTRTLRGSTSRGNTPQWQPNAGDPGSLFGLWLSLNRACEQKRAHEMCVLILEYWLGKKSKQELSKTLGVAPLRVWQLSQQAVSGMLAGLLKQPRRRRNAAELALLSPEEDPRLLKKRVRELETRLARTEDLVRVLRTAPWVAKKDASPTEVKRASRAKKKASPARRRNAQARRRAASVPSAQPSGAGGAGEGARAE